MTFDVAGPGFFLSPHIFKKLEDLQMLAPAIPELPKTLHDKTQPDSF
jgi:hypothetical protein